MSPVRSSAAPPDGRPVFVLGADPAASALLYRLLCLHPEIAYVGRFEERIPRLPVWLCGRIRLRRFSAKLRWWFRRPDAGPLLAALMRQLEPAGADALPRRLRVDGALPPERAAERLRQGIVRLQQAAGGRALVTLCRGDRVAAVAPLVPDARYLVVHGDAHGEARAPAGPCALLPAELAAVAPERVRPVHCGELVREPLEVMRELLGFLGLDRRLDYEWALKTLDLTPPSPHPSANPAGLPVLPGDEPLGGARYVS
ncbi:MAG TPA: hypothetical protein VF210_08565 [Pseudomonadales bacterium]